MHPRHLHSKWAFVSDFRAKTPTLLPEWWFFSTLLHQNWGAAIHICINNNKNKNKHPYSSLLLSNLSIPTQLLLFSSLSIQEKNPPFRKTLIYFRLLQYLFRDYFLGELEGTHSIDCHYFHVRITLFKSGGPNSQHRKLWAVSFKPGPVAEDIEWSFRVKGLGFTRQQIWTRDLCGTKTKGHRLKPSLAPWCLLLWRRLVFFFWGVPKEFPKFPNSTTLLSPLLLCPKVSPPFACTSRGATIGERALHLPIETSILRSLQSFGFIIIIYYYYYIFKINLK